VRLGAARAGVLSLALALAAGAPGCVALGRGQAGSIPSQETISALEEGDTIAVVLTSCGPPLEVWRHPDGMVLIWRSRRFDYDRIGIDPSRAVSFLEVANVAATLLSNLKLTFEWATAFEDRLVAIFDRSDRLVAWAYREGSDESPVGDAGQAGGAPGEPK